MSAVKFDGIKVTMGGKDFVLPPLTFRQLRNLEPKFVLVAGMAGMPTGEQQDAVLEIVHTALSRNYPELSLDEVGDLIDLGNLAGVMKAVMGVSGLTGEAKAGTV